MRSAAAALAAVLAVTLGGCATAPRAPESAEPSPAGPPGARVLGSEAPAGGYTAQETAASLSPAPSLAEQDTTMPGSGCHADWATAEVQRCVLHQGAGRKVLIAGDSHAGQWMPAFRQVGEQRDWQLEMATKSSCPLIEVDLLDSTMKPYAACAVWVRGMMAHLAGPSRPDVLVVSHSNYLQFVAEQGSMSSRRKHLIRAETNTLSTLVKAGMEVVVLRDTPQFATPVPECVTGNPRQLSRCGTQRGQAEARSAAGQDEVARRLGARLVDLNDVLCPQDFCPAVIGDIVVWRDTNHVTASYAATAGEFVQERFPQI